jgi:hypothetical protein
MRLSNAKFLGGKKKVKKVAFALRQARRDEEKLRSAKIIEQMKEADKCETLTNPPLQTTEPLGMRMMKEDVIAPVAEEENKEKQEKIT